MNDAIYLSKNNNFEYFVFKKPKDYSDKLISIEKVSDSVDNTKQTDAIAVAREAFKNAKSVEYIEIKPTVQRIEESAFEKCEDLKTVIFGELKDSNELKAILVEAKGDLTIQSSAFKNCEKLETVIFPSVSSKFTLEKNSFSNCKNLRTVVFAYNWNAEIDETAFIGCPNLTFICSFGSSAERFAREHGIRIVNY